MRVSGYQARLIGAGLHFRHFALEIRLVRLILVDWKWDIVLWVAQIDVLYAVLQ